MQDNITQKSWSLEQTPDIQSRLLVVSLTLNLLAPTTVGARINP